MNYLLSILIIAVLASQATIWHSLATIRDAIQQTNAIILAACGSGGDWERVIMIVRNFEPCWKACVARTALLSCAARKGSIT